MVIAENCSINCDCTLICVRHNALFIQRLCIRQFSWGFLHRLWTFLLVTWLIITSLPNQDVCVKVGCLFSILSRVKPSCSEATLCACAIVRTSITDSGAYKGGPNSVSKNHISLLYPLVLIMTIFPFLLCWCKPQSRRFEARRGLGEARWGLGEAMLRTQNVLAQGQSEAHRDSKLYKTIVEVPVKLNLKVVDACAASLEF